MRAGEEDNQHIIELSSSKNSTLSNNYEGNGFQSGSTIFEEFFHAAHLEYLKSISKFSETTQYSQTETEVEFAQAFAYYVMNLNKERYPNSLSGSFDGYNILDDFLNYDLIAVFEKINKKENLLLDDRVIIYNTMKEIIKRKKKDYKSLNYKELDNLFYFTYYLINQSNK